ncbi:hypothetical protein BDV93DRAFT_259212 [Ceratobasidium sp. AG-I]|nr:hypothetical protein BDV93DRAFT_259212 [Ceratobasidium sp. AG-I]
MFGLSLCMDEDGAKNDGSASQAFRFLPDSGVVQPFYEVRGAGDRMLELVDERAEKMDAEAGIQGVQGGAEMVDSNSTAASPDLVPVVVASNININATTVTDNLILGGSPADPHELDFIIGTRSPFTSRLPRQYDQCYSVNVDGSSSRAWLFLDTKLYHLRARLSYWELAVRWCRFGCYRSRIEEPCWLSDGIPSSGQRPFAPTKQA